MIPLTPDVENSANEQRMFSSLPSVAASSAGTKTVTMKRQIISKRITNTALYGTGMYSYTHNVARKNQTYIAIAICMITDLNGGVMARSPFAPN